MTEGLLLQRLPVCSRGLASPPSRAEPDAAVELSVGGRFEEVAADFRSNHGWGDTQFRAFDVELRSRGSNVILAHEKVFTVSPILFVGMEKRCPRAEDRIAEILGDMLRE